MPVRNAFTLVELLVVITIIVVLLAMLAPAMDQAIYQAELTVCGARLKAVCNGVTTYATGNKRYYPNHLTQTQGPGRIKTSTDERIRTVLRGILSINATLNDPLSKAVDLDRAPSTVVTCSYPLWFGWGFDGEKRMMKLGDRWTYVTPGTTPITDSFSVIASDFVSGSVNRTFSSHSDRGNVMVPVVWNDQQIPRELPRDVPGFEGANAPNDATYTLSGWADDPGVPPRLRFDLNWGYADNSVRRLSEVQPDPADTRITKVPGYVPKTYEGTVWHWVPQE